MSPEELQEIQDLAKKGVSIRAIAKKLGRNVKTIREALGTAPRPRPPSKLEPFKQIVRELVQKDLLAPRILREIKEHGYTGSISILKDFIRLVRGGPLRKKKKIVKRFETKPAQEAQCDWSPYRVKIAGIQTLVQCFSIILAYSRMMFIAFYRNERLPTLMHAHVQALNFFGAVPMKIRYDNQTAVTLGRLRGQPLWNPTFLQFSKHYAFKLGVCRPKHKERQGKIERPFGYIEESFVKASEFESWEDLNRRARLWLDTVANVRTHETTHRVPLQAFAEEKPLMMALPTLAPATHRQELRKVQVDGCVVVDGTFYPVPDPVVGQVIQVRVYPEQVQILNARGEVAAAYGIPDRPGRIAAPGGSGAAGEPHYAAMSRPRLEQAFLTRFPQAEQFLDGLKRRMNALTPIHLRKIQMLVQMYSSEAVAQAIHRATEYRNFSAVAIERILQKLFPNVVEEPPITPTTATPAALGALDDVDSGSPTDYTLDSMEPTKGDEDAPEE
jgi:transposase